MRALFWPSLLLAVVSFGLFLTALVLGYWLNSVAFGLGVGTGLLSADTARTLRRTGAAA